MSIQTSLASSRERSGLLRSAVVMGGQVLGLLSLGTALGLGASMKSAEAATTLYIPGTGVNTTTGTYVIPPGRTGAGTTVNVLLDSNWKVIAYPTTPRLAGGDCWPSPTIPSSTLTCANYSNQPAQSYTDNPATLGYAPVISTANLISAWSDKSGRTCKDASGVDATCFWALPNRDSASVVAPGPVTYPSNQNINMRSLYGPFCPSADAFNAVCYNWILQTEFDAGAGGYFKFSMDAGADNVAKVWLDGAIVSNNGVVFPTQARPFNGVADISGGTLLGQRTETGDGSNTAYTVGPITNIASRYYLAPGMHKISIVISDGWSGTGAFVGTTSFELVPGPLPILGAGAAIGWSRRLRKRIALSQRSIAESQSA